MPVAVLPRFAARFAARLPHARRAAALCAALAAAATLAACSNPSPTREVHASVDTVALFPIANYDQNVDHWLEPDSPGYDQPFLSPADQQAHFSALYARYFGTGTTAPSPWNSAYVAMRVYRQQGADIVALQQRRIDKFDNTGKSGAASATARISGRTTRRGSTPSRKTWTSTSSRRRPSTSPNAARSPPAT